MLAPVRPPVRLVVDPHAASEPIVTLNRRISMTIPDQSEPPVFKMHNGDRGAAS
jgi:hypothetical protein